MNRTLRAIIACLFVAVITCSVVSIFTNLTPNLRLDITDQHIYTLSPGTRNIINSINQPISVTLYYSQTAALQGPDRIQFYNAYARYVDDLLREYANVSHGMIAYQFVDPRPFTDAEEQAFVQGLEFLRMGDQDREKLIFGLVLQTRFGVTETIPFFTPNRRNFVEYDITSLIDAAVNRQKPTIGVLSSYQVVGDDGNPRLMQLMLNQGLQPRISWAIINQLRQRYNIQTIPTDTSEISNIDLLLLIQPQDFSEQTLRAIDRFVVQGHPAVILADPYCSTALTNQPTDDTTTDRSAAPHQINRLLNAWGLNIPENTFAGDRSLAITQRSEQFPMPQPHIGYLRLQNTCINRDNIAAANLENIFVLLTGVLQRTNQNNPDNNIRYTTLLQTTSSGNACQIPPELARINIMDINPARLMTYFTPGNQPVCIASLISGPLQTAFPNNTDPCDSSQPQDCAVAVFADVDFITEILAYDYNPETNSYLPRNDNSSLLLNTIDLLLLNTIENSSTFSELISLRSRGSLARPFTVVDQIENQAEINYAQQFQNIQEQIDLYNQQLASLSVPNNQSDNAMTESDIFDRRREIIQQANQARRQLRQLALAKRQDIDALGNKLRLINIVLVPAVVLTIGISLALYRAYRRRKPSR
ncbi:MAG: Gldg family protein [Sedimentisphaerales bacterium]|nr:Gldg family protein [Sedimentisphaerales bacterium]